MPVVTRRRSVRLLLVIAAGFPLLLAGGAAVLTVVIGQSCTGSGVGDAPSPGAVRDIPPGMLAIYSGSTPRTSCRGRSWPGSARRSATPASSRTRRARRSPGEGPRGAANFAGASGPMQVGIGGAAGDEYDALRHLLPDPSLGPHDPTTAVELAALMLTRDKGAPTGQPIDALPRLRACVNGAGPMAEAYAARVLADAHAEVQAMIAAGNRINHFPYSYGGAHGDAAQTMSQANPNPAAVPGEENGDPGYDCSSATCTSCGPGGLGQSVLGGGVDDSTGLETVGDPGPGKWTTIYANAGQAYIEIADIYFDTAAGLGNAPNPPATGPRWSTVGNGPDGFAARHPPGL